jgi:hypothetical protein
MNNLFEAYSIYKKLFSEQINILNKLPEPTPHLSDKTSKFLKQVNWSHLLFQDLINLKLNEKIIGKDLINSRKFLSKKTLFYYFNFFFNKLFNMFFFSFDSYNRFSFFYDLSQKVLFYKFVKNLQLDKSKKVLLPEVGFTGFCAVILKKMGFKYIFAYDQDRNIRYSIKKIWAIDTVIKNNTYFSRSSSYSSRVPSLKNKIALTVSSSSKINLNNYLKNDFTIILQGWHSPILNFKCKQLIKQYPSQIFSFDLDKKNFRSILKKLKRKDYVDFINEVLN